MNKSGIIIVDKPKGMSTNKLIQLLKRKMNIKKIGHAGTLDPLATGLVICLLNNATKLSDYFLNENKNYEFEITLFKSTSTYDAEGEIINQEEAREIELQTLNEVILKFDGLTYDQEPPIFSAIKINGKKLYEYAREGKEVEIKKRRITINQLHLLSYDKKNNSIKLQANCSKGTYIRSLACDIAHSLNTIGYVSELRRMQSGHFLIEDSKELDKIDEKDIINIYDSLKLAKLSIIHLNELADVNNGKKLKLDSKDKIVFISDSHQNVYACYEKIENDIYKCRRGGLNDASN
ncbi:tRNA pseudouridine(55) synthase TruB [Mesoplasma corruscae]|uniref:tRNA pseudouridine synthase B n=1 Tax=Mesoplasma corruscae TaxID=216874 RepID=A0A2S5RGZ5_9MOLU|nr:tRNA pseudouridine(55) synthase TruB [Mesoplasma corruscae]PPE06395.1 tRNA pseudouridine synthase B [Mesoplasma corruscae]